MVVPAFELVSSPKECTKNLTGVKVESLPSNHSLLRGKRDCNERYMPRNFAELVSCVQKKNCRQFDAWNKGGHGSTNLNEWKTKNQHSFLELSCVESMRYEPYLVIPMSSNTPLYEETFIG